MGEAITFCLVVVGLIKFAPVIGVISAQKLESAYSVALAGNDLEILMRCQALRAVRNASRVWTRIPCSKPFCNSFTRCWSALAIFVVAVIRCPLYKFRRRTAPRV